VRFSLLTRQSMVSLLALSAVAVGCSSAEPARGTVDPDAGADAATGDPPHALGVITLGERHSTGSSEVTPIASAAFFPDAATLPARCATDVAGCSVSFLPECGTCREGETCTFDDACSMVCAKTCESGCGSDEECYAPPSGVSVCRKRESFDAGPLAFTGTRAPLTLFPPYAAPSTLKGAPFAPGAELHVKATGASGLGFEAFEDDFTAVARFETKPSLANIPAGVVFGNGPIPISWTPGTDKVEITVAGSRGTVTCQADDAAGSFQIPREALKAVSGGTTDRYFQMSATRVKKEVRKDKATKAGISSRLVQPIGWVELTTSSTESAELSCAARNKICSDACVDILTSPANCGGCGRACPAGDKCTTGRCNGPTSCDTCTKAASTTGACVSQDAACKASPECATIQTCVAACKDQTCASACVTRATTTAQNLYRTVAQCICNSGCPNECATACGR